MRTAVGPEGIQIDPAVFAALCLASPLAVARADLLYQGETVQTGLRVSAGSVTSDRRAAQRSRCTVTLAEPTMIPTLDDGTLRPDGHELQLFRGVQVRSTASYVTMTDYLTGGGDYLTGGGEFLVIGDELTEIGATVPAYDLLVPLGAFRIQRGQVDAETLETRIEGADRAWPVSYARLEDAVAWDPSMNLEQAVLDLVYDAIGDVDVDVSGVDHACPTLVHERQADPWAIIMEAAASVGYVAYFGSRGQFIWAPDPVLDGVDPVGEVVDGPGGNLIDLTVEQQAEATFNRVVAVGSNPDLTAEYVGVATDNDPGSPTRYGGPFGKKPRFYASPFLTSNDKAQMAAESIMRDQVGIVDSYRLSMLTNPTLEVGDSVRLRCDRVGVNTVVVFDEMTVELGAEGATSVTVHSALPVEEPS